MGTGGSACPKTHDFATLTSYRPYTLDVLLVIELDDRTHDAGSDRQRNAITHAAGHASDRVTRRYTPSELKQHRQITIQQAQSAAHWQLGRLAAEQDQELILFYAQCLDRPAFRTRFTNEDSFSDFDRAMEDTLPAINTGYARLKDGTTTERAQGKVHLVRADWREKMDQIAAIIEEVRS